MITNPIGSTVILLSNLSRSRRDFDQGKHQAVKALVLKQKQQAVVVVHPLYNDDDIDALHASIADIRLVNQAIEKNEPGQMFKQQLEKLNSLRLTKARVLASLADNQAIRENIDRAEISGSATARYSAYLSRLGQYLKSTLAPIFIFSAAPDRRNIEHWLDSLSSLPAPVIMVDALGRDATPWFDTPLKDEAAWHQLAEIFDQLSIRNITIGGENGYTVKNVSHGCVYRVNANLHARSFSVTVEKPLIYPGFNV